MKIMTNVKLGVNIDHVATLRQARRDVEPDPIAAARVARQAGADMIVTHLRRDRRHIQDEDLKTLCKLKFDVHLEIAPTSEMVAIACKTKPDSVCLVPENPKEITTEGGLNIKKNEAAVKSAVSRLKRAGIEVSLFVDPEAVSVRAAITSFWMA